MYAHLSEPHNLHMNNLCFYAFLICVWIYWVQIPVVYVIMSPTYVDRISLSLAAPRNLPTYLNKHLPRNLAAWAFIEAVCARV